MFGCRKGKGVFGVLVGRSLGEMNEILENEFFLKW